MSENSAEIPKFHFLIYIISGFSAFLGAVTISIITKNTPIAMRTYSKFLLLYLTLEMVFTLAYGLGMAAVTIFPVIGFFSTGFLRFFGISTRFQLHVISFVMVLYLCSILPLILYRQQVVLADDYWMKMRKRTFILIIIYNFIAPNLVLQITIFLATKEQTSLRKAYQLSFGHSVEICDYFDCFLLDEAGLKTILYGLAFQFFTATLNSVIVLGSTAYVLQFKCSHMSQRTRYLQKKVFLSMNVQITTAVLLMFMPTFLIFLHFLFAGSMALDSAITSIVQIIFSSHGIGSNFCILALYDPYRQFWIKIVQKGLGMNGISSISGYRQSLGSSTAINQRPASK